MRRTFPLTVVTLVLAVSACSGGDDTATTTATTPISIVPLSAIAPPDATDECEDAPDPAALVDGQAPQVLRPCAIPTELVVQSITPGAGRPAAIGDRVIIDFTGVRAENGDIFDSTYLRGVPSDVLLGGPAVLQGFSRGLEGVQAGAVVKLDVPSDLAYGETPPAGDVLQPGDAVSYVVEVRVVVPLVRPEDAPLDLQIEPSVGALEVSSEDLVVGDGPAVEPGKTAVVHMLLVRGDNEIVVFNSWTRNDPLQIIMQEGATLPGIIEGLEGATVGTLRAIIVPPDQGFGVDGETSLGLPPDTDLIVIIDVIGVY
jgi:FKBP-type peptidyl-prolyl cis-trans isomerase